MRTGGNRVETERVREGWRRGGSRERERGREGEEAILTKQRAWQAVSSFGIKGDFCNITNCEENGGKLRRIENGG